MEEGNITFDESCIMEEGNITFDESCIMEEGNITFDKSCCALPLPQSSVTILPRYISVQSTTQAFKMASIQTVITLFHS